ncbi:MAG: DNRLRE domain-containing protein [Planctomycetota bacterium]
MTQQHLSFRRLSFTQSVLLVLGILIGPLSATQENAPQLEPDIPYRGIAIDSNCVRSKLVPGIEAVIRECRVNLVVIDFSWIDWIWEYLDLEDISAVVDRLQKAGVVTSAMYRPQACKTEGVNAHFAQINDPTIPVHVRYLCFAHADSREWGLSWGEKILAACPHLDSLILYDVQPVCQCEQCSGEAGKNNVAGFLAACRDRWQQIRKDVRIGHSGPALEYADQVDFFCPRLALRRADVSQPVETEELVKQAVALRVAAGRKPVVPLAEIAFSHDLPGTTEDIVAAIRSCDKAKLAYVLWHCNWIVQSETDRYDPGPVVRALGGDWEKLEPFFAPKIGSLPWQTYFPSRESKVGETPRLVITNRDGSSSALPASRDTYLSEGVPERANGSELQLFSSGFQRTFVLIGFHLPEPLYGREISKAELALDFRIRIPPAEPLEFAVHLLEGAWVEKHTTWNRCPPFQSEPCARVTLDPAQMPFRIDVTEAVRVWLSGKAPNNGFLLSGRIPQPRELPTRLFETVAWESTVANARRRASEEERLILACVGSDLGGDPSFHPRSGAAVLLALAFTDPTIVDLVKHRFVPVRIRYLPMVYTYHRTLGDADPLAELGGESRTIKSPALCVSTPEGELLASLQSIGTFDTGTFTRFLLSSLVKTRKYSRSVAGDAEELVAAGALEQAELAFESLPSPRREYGLSLVAARRGDYVRAAQLAESVAQSESDLAADARVQWGTSLLRQGEFERAVRLLAEAVERQPRAYSGAAPPHGAGQVGETPPRAHRRSPVATREFAKPRRGQPSNSTDPLGSSCACRPRTPSEQ